MLSKDNSIGQEYAKSLNRAFQFIEYNLHNRLTLENVSEAACYSVYHFHRIFKAITQETLNEYIHRKRVEKAALILQRKKATTIAEVTFATGFSSNSSFTRAFKKYYGVSPSDFRKANPSPYSKISQTESKNGQISRSFESYLYNMENLMQWISTKTQIEVKELNEIPAAYLTQIGDEGMGEAFVKLMKWARPKGLLDKPDFKMGTIYHDSFKVTAADKVRMSICLFLDEPVKTDGEVGLTKIESGKYIVARNEVTVDEIGKSWTALFIWMNEKGYQKADRNPFEIYHNDFNTHPEKKCLMDMCIPVY